MIISLVVAAAENNVIGRDNALPWKLPADLKHFKDITLGKPVIMGRNTWSSIGKPLPGRHNIVVSRKRDTALPQCTVVHSIEMALQAAGAVPEVMVIGGAYIYEQCLPIAQRIYLTRVHAQIAGDAVFPDLDAQVWRLISRQDHVCDARNPYDYSFMLFERNESVV